MIRNESLQLASLIAMAPNLSVQPTPLLQSLTDASVGSMLYGENFVGEVQHVTSDNEHTFIMDELSSQLAAIVRNSLETIRDYGIPVAKVVSAATSMIDTPKGVTETALSQVWFRFINVDEPFFDSSVYPTEVRNNSFTYTGVDLSKLNSLEWTYASDKEVRNFIGTDHPELITLLDDPECSLGYVAESFFTGRTLQDKFSHNGKVFDFTKVKMGDIHFLLKAYILFAKMYSSEDPAPWLKGGRLEDYREMVNLIYNGLIVYLINLKRLVLQYRQMGLAVILQKGPVVLTNDRNKLEVKANVFFTNNVLEAVMGKGYALADLLVGAYYGAATNNRPMSYTDMLANPAEAMADFNRYLSMFVGGATTDLKTLFFDASYEAISKYLLAVPELKDRLEKARGNSNETFSTWLKKTFQMPLEHCFIAVGNTGSNQTCEAIGDVPSDQPNPRLLAILNTKLVPTLLEALGCDLAAEIIRSTYVEQQSEDNVANQRERVRVAVINALVNRSLVKAE